ncbi:MAG: DNA recombination protein RmuC [Acidimicrobiaceae bacterium]|nr:DNA recombination protein RmuC [Acidimicrobiaceae bacterium]
MEATLIVITILLAVALIVQAVRSASRRNTREAADQNQRELESLRGSVERLEERVRDQLAPQVGSVEKIAEDLQRTPYAPNRRGQWAEQSLANLFEDSGSREGHDYRLQQTIREGDNTLRPDAVVSKPKRGAFL